MTGALPAAPVSDALRMVLGTRMLIAQAYNLPLSSAKGQIFGGPGWLDTNLYEVRAKVEASLNATMQAMSPEQRKEQIELMEQSLLVDRFKLKMHFDTRELPVYALVAAKGGPKLAPANTDTATHASIVAHGQEVELKATALAPDALLRMLQQQPEVGGRPVVDQAGLHGTYDVAMKWTRDLTAMGGADAAPLTNADAPSYFTALQEQLGLRLVPAKASVEVIVIDHIEVPSEN
jgi:bla regulator protein blaR1